ncbi:hypothetical protein ACP0AK_08405 [Listeria ivanovii]|uniref:hypothetical protein n=1 Tax=Listeria ivanovii TaxID=1638 RepID=UPI0002E0CA5E|nr:hypothetical protein [Listeria ivanovii]AHI56603.1 hypothetical protein AX25_11065 [Listeria ivanovii WSLC3009]MBC1758938.1 hypothetical protein [Listeria ivanovii]MBK3913961.1 hypothetical protein [Listeria ivanovii subsp. ivanovii]MBK3921201.1 hypothetical protein [Listeria ivanovii subsp. ivanovii]MBK3926365.1 hypothetical protein [Listeria ivanovii subsp. ivanovii]
MSEKYYPLKTIFHQNEDDYKQELDLRKNSYGTYLTNLEITPIVNGTFNSPKLNLFLVNTKKLQSLLQEALANSKEIELNSRKLPTHALQQYFDSLLINELQSTNEIEGVRSTKKKFLRRLMNLEKMVRELKMRKDLSVL